MIIESDRQMAIDLIDEAVESGARQSKACDVLSISTRTLSRWKLQLHEQAQLNDRRKDAARKRIPANALTPEEREQIIVCCNQPQYQNLPPSQIVPKLADKGIYLASESSFHRILKSVNQLNHRGRAKAH